jgi:predicted TIM-barrel fold metal-dependent hydrolase
VKPPTLAQDTAPLFALPPKKRAPFDLARTFALRAFSGRTGHTWERARLLMCGIPRRKTRTRGPALSWRRKTTARIHARDFIEEEYMFGFEGKIALACGCSTQATGLPDAGRRGFVAGAAAFGALAASGCATTQSAAPHRIDVHHHISPPAWVTALKAAKLDSPPVNNWTPQKSIEDLDRGGVATAITSPTLPAAGFLNAQDAAAVVRASNEYARKLADDSKGRFRMFAMLPMPHVDETLKEIAYAMDVLKADGVAFMTSYGNKYLGDPAFAPVMDELQRRKATAYTHPNDPACCLNIASGVPPVIIEYGTDTTRTIASLVFSGTARRCKDINFIFSHAGGTLSALTERFLVQVVSFPQFKERGFDATRVLAELRQFYYDTAQASNPVAMASLTKFIPISNIVYGTDYPYRTAAEHTKGLAEVFSGADLRAIERENALRILPRMRGA